LNLINELYDNNMWVTDLHKELLEKHVNEDGWDERKILEVLDVSSDGAKKNFLKVFERSGWAGPEEKPSLKIFCKWESV